MLGNCQQNSRILILSIYSLSNIYIFIVKIFRIFKIVCRGQCPLVGEECGVTHQPQMLKPCPSQMAAPK